MIQMRIVALSIAAALAVLVSLGVMCVRALRAWVRALWPH